MPKEDKPHHIILIIALLIMYLLFLLGYTFLSRFIQGTGMGIYFFIGLISLVIGAAVFRLYHETEYNKKPLYYLFFITNLFIAGILSINVFVYTLVLRLSSQITYFGNMANEASPPLAQIFGVGPDPYLLSSVAFGLFNLFYLAHLFEKKRKKELWLFLIPIALFIIAAIIFKYLAGKLLLLGI